MSLPKGAKAICLRSTLVGLLMLAAFSYGVASYRYRLFPFDMIQHAKHVASTSGYSPYYCSKRATFSAFAAPADVVMLGDSITDWGDAFVQATYPALRVVNMGISGDTVHGLLDRLDPVLACTPRQVFVLAGINDLKNGCSVEQIAGDYQALIAKLHAANVDVFVQSVLYSSDLGLRQLKPKITALNTRLQEVCREHHATFVDLTPHLCAGQNMRSDFTVDGTHLSGAAYRVWAEALQSHLAALPGCDQPLALAH